MKKFLLCFGAVLAYWALMFLGPAIVMLFNNIGYYVTGGGWGPDSLMYAVLQFFSQPISCFVAYGAATAILKENGKILILVNCVVAACMCVLFAITASETSQRFAMIVSVVACVYTAVMAAKNIKQTQAKEITNVSN